MARTPWPARRFRLVFRSGCICIRPPTHYFFSLSRCTHREQQCPGKIRSVSNRGNAAGVHPRFPGLPQPILRTWKECRSICVVAQRAGREDKMVSRSCITRIVRSESCRCYKHWLIWQYRNSRMAVALSLQMHGRPIIVSRQSLVAAVHVHV